MRLDSETIKSLSGAPLTILVVAVLGFLLFEFQRQASNQQVDSVNATNALTVAIESMNLAAATQTEFLNKWHSESILIDQKVDQCQKNMRILVDRGLLPQQ